ncbi:MAG: hypothetical protein OIF50_10330 [Flavobacteriaceae bacterium]|nr:hypothetical protein [Flavobacteriaceae bacterium]
MDGCHGFCFVLALGLKLLLGSYKSFMDMSLECKKISMAWWAFANAKHYMGSHLYGFPKWSETLKEKAFGMHATWFCPDVSIFLAKLSGEKTKWTIHPLLPNK